MEKCPGCVDFSTCVKDQRAKSAGCKHYLGQNSYLTKKEDAPLDACTKCKQRRCLIDGVICKKVEKLLVKISSGRINSKEFSTDQVEILYQLNKEKECGWRKKPTIQPEKWDED